MKAESFVPIKEPNRLLSYFRCQKKNILLTAISGTLFNGLMFLGPRLQGKLVDSIVTKENIHQVLLRAMYFIGTILLIQILRFIKRYYVRT